jgi:hypothetical protein
LGVVDMTAVLRRWVALVAVVVLGTTGIAVSAASGGDRSTRFSADLEGFQEVPAVSTVAGGSFRAKVSSAGDSVRWRLRYSGLESPVLMAHVHVGQEAVNGGVSVWLCTTPGAPLVAPAGTPTCPGPTGGTVSGTLTSAGVVGPAGQGIAAGELGELLAAMKAEVAYANVHSTTFPGGEIRGQVEDHEDDDD